MTRAKALRHSDPVRVFATDPPQWCGAVGVAIGTMLADLAHSYPTDIAGLVGQANEALTKLGCPLRIVTNTQESFGNPAKGTAPPQQRGAVSSNNRKETA